MVGIVGGLVATGEAGVEALVGLARPVTLALTRMDGDWRPSVSDWAGVSRRELGGECEGAEGWRDE